MSSIFTPEAMHPYQLPIFSSGEELASMLDHYLSNPILRQKVTSKMREIILQHHTYTVRSKQFAEHLSKLHVTIQPKSEIMKEVSKTEIIPVADPPKVKALPTLNAKALQAKNAKKSSMCIGIRTMSPQANALELLIKSFLNQYKMSQFKESIDLKIFIIDTETTTPNFRTFLTTMIDNANTDMQRRIVFFASEKHAPTREKKNPFYGYDSTDFIVSHMLHIYQNSMSSRHYLHMPSTCDWLMLTNGDNMYNSAWFDAIAPYISKPAYDLVGWDFISHHIREGESNQLIRIELKRKYVDLGSVIIRSNLYLKAKSEFLPDSVFTKDLFARDFLMLQAMLPFTSPEKCHLQHRCLLFHQ